MSLRAPGSILSASQFEAIARQTLEPEVLAFLAGGAADEISLQENLDSFRRRRLRPKALAGAGEAQLEEQLLGQPAAMPIALAPIGANGLVHPEAELAVARAAAAAGVLHVVSMVSTLPLEEVARAGGRRWLQLYLHRDRGVTRALIQRAQAAGYSGLVLTVDVPQLGLRESELRAGFRFPAEKLGNLQDPADLDGLFQPEHGWSEAEEIAAFTSLPLVIKGVMQGSDAVLALDHGAKAVVVSNHGGRQLDRSPAPLDVLEEVAAAVGGRAEVYLDGGVRRGADAVIARALGAKAVMVGRPFFAALAVAGEAGVARLLQLLRVELADTLCQLGLRAMAEVRRDHVI
jgi:4-hydroxymandelate oxidase